MAVVKVIEVLAQSPKGWEDAAQVGLAEVTRTLHGVQSMWVKDMQVVIEDDRIAQYRLNLKVSFVIEEEERETKKRRK